MARLDVFLKNTGLFKARAQARRACDEGRVRIDGAPARGARAVRVGERLEVDSGTCRVVVEVLQVPEVPVARARRDECLRLLRREALPEEILSFDDEL